MSSLDFFAPSVRVRLLTRCAVSCLFALRCSQRGGIIAGMTDFEAFISTFLPLELDAWGLVSSSGGFIWWLTVLGVDKSCFSYRLQRG